MNVIFSFFLIMGIGFFLANGNAGGLMTTITKTTSDCGSFVLKLLFLTAFFSGVIQVGEEAGIVRKLSKFLRPFLRRIFNTKCETTLDKISVNIGANLLGIGNAATPSGLAAMEELNREHKNRIYPSDDMCRFILFNTCSVQLIPTTILGLRAMAGSATPAGIVLPVILVSFSSLALGFFLCQWLLRIRRGRQL